MACRMFKAEKHAAGESIPDSCECNERYVTASQHTMAYGRIGCWQPTGDFKSNELYNII